MAKAIPVLAALPLKPAQNVCAVCLPSARRHRLGPVPAAIQAAGHGVSGRLLEK
tara:strand:+ start:116 stop:277 length:162 start_codon:yes stop_codon:yes gene_type:complete